MINSLTRTFKVWCSGNSPIAMIVYLIVAIGGFILYQFVGIFEIISNSKISIIHPILSDLLGLMALWSFYKTLTTPPGKLTKENVKI